MNPTIRRTTQFKRDIKRLLRSGKDIEKLLSIVEELAEGRKYLLATKTIPLAANMRISVIVISSLIGF